NIRRTSGGRRGSGCDRRGERTRMGHLRLSVLLGVGLLGCASGGASEARVAALEKQLEALAAAPSPAEAQASLLERLDTVASRAEASNEALAARIAALEASAKAPKPVSVQAPPPAPTPAPAATPAQ